MRLLLLGGVMRLLLLGPPCPRPLLSACLGFWLQSRQGLRCGWMEWSGFPIRSALCDAEWTQRAKRAWCVVNGSWWLAGCLVL